MKPLRFGIVSGVLVFATIIAACSEDKEDPDAAAQTQFLTDYCKIIEPCCPAIPGAVAGAEACQKRIREIDPAIVKDVRARTDCLAQLRDLTPKNDFCEEFGNLTQPACPDLRRKLTTGVKKPGDPCTTDAECAPSYDGFVTCKTVCQLTKRGKEGDGPCVMTVVGDIERPLKEPAAGPAAFICYTRDGIYCDTDAKKCQKPLALGAECARDEQCEKTAFCNPNTNKCANRKSVGNSCSIDSECARVAHCEEAFCANDTLKEGEACEKDELCETDFCIDGKCVKAQPDVRLTNSCVDAKKDGG